MPHPPLYKEGWGYSKRGVKGNSMADQKKLNQYATANFKTRFNEGDAGTGTSPAALYPSVGLPMADVPVRRQPIL